MAQKISKKKSYIGENIKKIRQVKRISQADFASLFELARPSVGAYEEGRSEPKIETIIRIAQHFRIPVDALLMRSLSVNELFSLDAIKDKLNKAHNLQDEVVAFVEEEKKGIPYITISEQINYIVNFKSQEFIKSMPHIQLPIDESKNVRAFEMNGSEMEYHQQGIHHGDILVAEAIDPNKISTYVGKIITVIHQEGILTRRLQSVEDDVLAFQSDDPNYAIVSYKEDQVIEFWLVKATYSHYLNPPTLIEERVLKLENEMERLRNNWKSGE